jgi:uncharacterized membrane protein
MSGYGYQVFKVLHVFAAVIFLGNILLAVFWKAHADRTGDPRVIAHTIEGIIRADRWFTMPGVTLLILTGFGAAGLMRIPLTSFWIVASLVLLAVSAAAFMGRLVPIQRRMLALTRSAAGGGVFDRARYRLLSRQWIIWGVIATVTPLIALVLMVTKPTWQAAA